MLKSCSGISKDLAAEGWPAQWRIILASLIFILFNDLAEDMLILL